MKMFKTSSRIMSEELEKINNSLKLGGKNMRIIDLLNKIANGEEVPKRIKYFGLVYEHCDRCKQYEHNDVGVNIKLFEEIVDLTDTVEIIDDEEKGLPEKIKITEKSITVKGTTFFRDKDIEIFQKLSMQINEIIDYLEKQKKGE